jgi:1-acyl-sn-glycerol-3-phosphate acyltransferase
MDVVSNSELIGSFPENRRQSRFGRLRRAKHALPDLPVSQSKAPGWFYDLSRAVWQGVFKCTMRVETSGLELLKNSEGGVLIAVSHVSHLDPIVVSALLSRRISWISRVEFYRQWLMRTVLYHGGAFRVDRNGSALPTIREGLKRLDRGEAVGIFPEGELMRGENSVLRGASVKRGVCTLAARSGCPVVPVVVLGTDRLSKIGPWLPAKRGRLWVLVGTPMQASEGARTKTGRAEFAAELEAEYVRLFAKMRKEFGLPETIVP